MTKGKSRYFLIGGIILLVCIFVGISYAYWQLTLQQTNKNVVTTDCFDITFQENSDAITLNKAYPISDAEGMKSSPYTFTITNQCSSSASYQVNLEVLNTTTLTNANYISVMFGNAAPDLLSSYSTVTPTLSEAQTSYRLMTGYLDPNGSVTYDLRLWLDGETGPNPDSMNKTFQSKITVVASYITETASDYEICVGRYGEDSTNCQIIAEAMSDEGACPTVQEDGSVVVSNIEGTNSYVCSAPDNYGNSYYFRGNVTNNYVKFGKNEQGQDMYWRIIRINGDGSIRLIYDGTSAHANGEDSADRQIGTSAYNSSSNDNAYVGYMYGTPGSSSYAETHTNTNDSTIKSYLDDWYKRVFSGTPYESYIVDNIFCNDRSFSDSNVGTGYGTNITYYRWYTTNRIELTCLNQGDRFTVNDEVIGNGDLIYPVGLITNDEAYLSGGYEVSNSSYYLYSGNIFWTMSPAGYVNGRADVRRIDSNGSLSYYVGSVTNLRDVRPVINLMTNSLKFGNGTMSNPYTVEG